MTFLRFPLRSLGFARVEEFLNLLSLCLSILLLNTSVSDRNAEVESLLEFLSRLVHRPDDLDKLVHSIFARR